MKYEQWRKEKLYKQQELERITEILVRSAAVLPPAALEALCKKQQELISERDRVVIGKSHIQTIRVITVFAWVILLFCIGLLFMPVCGEAKLIDGFVIIILILWVWIEAIPDLHV